MLIQQFKLFFLLIYCQNIVISPSFEGPAIERWNTPNRRVKGILNLEDYSLKVVKDTVNFSPFSALSNTKLAWFLQFILKFRD